MTDFTKTNLLTLAGIAVLIALAANDNVDFDPNLAPTNGIKIMEEE